jgi:hypothetical protein
MNDKSSAVLSWLPITALLVALVAAWFSPLPLFVAPAVAGGLAALLLVRRAIMALVRRGDKPRLTPRRALDAVVPAGLTAVLGTEARMLHCLLRWAARRQPDGAPDHFPYHTGRKLLFIAFGTLIAVEAALTHVVLLIIFGGRTWVWIVFAVDAYTLLWIVGLYAALVMLPHRLTPDNLVLRYGHLATLVVPRAAVVGARPSPRAMARTGRLVPGKSGDSATFACGETTVALTLDPAVPLTFRGRPVDQPISTLLVTADDPGAMVAALTAPRNQTTTAGQR